MSDKPLHGHYSDTYSFIRPEQFSNVLSGRNVLVTGAGRGIGRAISLAFAAAGANVICFARSGAELASVTSEIQSRHSTAASYCSVDVSDVDAVTSALHKMVERHGEIDILVNNAGIVRISPFECESDFQAWWNVVETNLKAPAALIHLLLPAMLRRGQGTIVSIGSRNAALNMPYFTAYSASKTGLLRLHQCLELEVRGRGPNLFVVEPGDVPTGIAHVPGALDVGAIERVPDFREMLQNTIGSCTETAELCADTCVWLAADPRAGSLSGMYIDATQGLQHLLHDLDKQGLSLIRQRNLHQLKVELAE